MNDLGIYTIAFLLVVIAACSAMLSDNVWAWWEQRQKHRKARRQLAAIVRASQDKSISYARFLKRRQGRRP